MPQFSNRRLAIFYSGAKNFSLSLFLNIKFSDFDLKLIDRVKNMIRKNNPTNHWHELESEEFLVRAGFYRKNEENKYGYTLSSVLFFGSDKLIEGAIDGVDKVYFTAEEKADLHLKFLKLYEPYKLIQRFMAIVVGIPFVAVYLFTVILIYLEEFKIAEMIAKYNIDTLGTPFNLIMGFLFAGGVIEGGIKAYKGAK